MQTIKLLGTPSIAIDGSPSRLGNSRTAIALLAYLAVQNEVQNREKVADIIWDDVTTSQSLQRLRELLVRVRAVLPALQTTRRTVALARTDAIRVDYWAVIDGLSSNDAVRLESALVHYGAPLLADFVLPGNPPFNEWLQVEREKLRVKVSDGFRRLTTQYESGQQWERGIAIAMRWVTHDSLNEAAHRSLMRQLVQTGQRSVALDHYQRLREQLYDELGVEPEAETVAWVKNLEQVVVDAPIAAPRWDGAMLPDPGSLPPQSVVPFQRNRDFVGREKTLMAIGAQLLGNGERKPVVLSGIGGVGKTQLAVEFVFRFGRFFQSACWLNFTDPATTFADLALIGGERGMQCYSDEENLSQREKVARVQRILQEPTPRLLIFDNCTDEELLLEHTPVTGGAVVLVTSTRAEWDHAVDVNQIALDVLARPDSIALLQKLTPRLSHAESDRIAEQVGDLPLALQLAGAYLKRYEAVSPHSYCKQLQGADGLQHPSLQGRGSRLSATRHALNVSHTFALSYDKLLVDEPEARQARLLLTCIACCASAESLPRSLVLRFLAEDKLAAVDALARLRILGFLPATNDDEIVVHRLINTFARARAGELLQTARARVAKAMTAVLQEKYDADTTIIPLPFAATHLHAVVTAALSERLPASAPLAGFWANYLVATVEMEQFAPYVDPAMTVVYDETLDAPTRATAMREIAYAIRGAGYKRQARQLLEDGLNIRIQLEGELHNRTADSYSDLGIMALEDGNFEEARRLLQRTVAISERLPTDQRDRFTYGFALLHIGLSFISTGEFAEGRGYVEAALAQYVAVLPNPHAHLASAHSMMGHVLFGTGNHAEALTHFSTAVEQFAAVLGADSFRMAIEQGNVASCLIELGDIAGAQRQAEQSFAVINQRYSETPQAAFSHFLMGKLAMLGNRPKAAETHLLISIDLYEGEPRYITEKQNAEDLLAELRQIP